MSAVENALSVYCVVAESFDEEENETGKMEEGWVPEIRSWHLSPADAESKKAEWEQKMAQRPLPYFRYRVQEWEQGQRLPRVQVTAEERAFIERWQTERAAERTQKWREEEQVRQKKRAETFCIVEHCPKYVQVPTFFCVDHQDKLQTQQFYTSGGCVYSTSKGEVVGYLGNEGPSV